MPRATRGLTRRRQFSFGQRDSDFLALAPGLHDRDDGDVLRLERKGYEPDDGVCAVDGLPVDRNDHVAAGRDRAAENVGITRAPAETCLLRRTAAVDIDDQRAVVDLVT